MDTEDQIKSYMSYINNTKMEEENDMAITKRRRLRKLDEDK